MIDLPEEIIELILSYAPDFRDNLKKCHTELLQDRPCFYKKVHLGYSPGLADDPMFIADPFINVAIPTPVSNNIQMMSLELHAIEITPKRPPNDRYWHDRDINLYYGWSKMSNKYFWNIILKANLHYDTFSPGYY